MRRVEHVETDASGVMHFSRYASMLESAVLEQLEAWGVGLDVLVARGLQIRVRDLRMRYRAAARFGDWIDCQVVLAHLGPIRMCFDGVMRRVADAGDAVLADGRLELVTVAVDDASPACLGDQLYDRLCPHARRGMAP